MFATFGVKHVKFHVRQAPGQDAGEHYSASQGRFGKAAKVDVLSACFLPKGLMVSGSQSGELLVWDTAGASKSGFGGCVQVCMGVGWFH